MQVLVSNSLFFHQKYGGVSRYATSLIKNLINENIDLKIISPLYKNNYLHKLEEIKKYGLFLSKYPRLKILEKANTFFTNYLKKNLKSNLVHDLYYPEKYVPFKKKNILTIHDTIHEKYNYLYNNDYFNFRKKIIENTDILICVSQNTKNDVIELYKVPENKIFVTPHGYDHLSNISPINIEKNEIFKKPFILYVGGRYKYKNFDFLLKAFSKSKKINNDFNLICYGGEKITNKEKKEIKSLGIENKLIELKGDDQLLKSLYLKTNLLVSTSDYEGFGLNVLEAISLDCPVLVNKIKVFEDIFKDSIKYYEYNDEDNLISSLENILLKNNYNINTKETNNILDKYNWKNCGKKTFEIYNLID